ncbi:AlbA family DNA-binding domain-containing protein [Desulfoplanes sp. PS50]|jgi:predicted HTH transcriptional regulator
MTATTIETLIASGESEILEFKKNFGKEAIIALSALANTMGGWVLLWVIN